MIEVLGAKRVIIIAAAVLLNAVLASAVYLYLGPQSVKVKRDLRRTKSEISQKRADINQLRMEYDEIQKEKVFFEDLTNAGFFSDQDRILVRRRFDEINRQVKVIRASYDIKPRQVVENKTAKKADYVELKSQISVSVDALDDNDFYQYIYLLENGFPGQVSVTSVDLQRKIDLSDTVFRAVETGIQPKIVSGKVDFTWDTMVPIKQIQAENNTGGL